MGNQSSIGDMNTMSGGGGVVTGSSSQHSHSHSFLPIHSHLHSSSSSSRTRRRPGAHSLHSHPHVNPPAAAVVGGAPAAASNGASASLQVGQAGSGVSAASAAVHSAVSSRVSTGIHLALMHQSSSNSHSLPSMNPALAQANGGGVDQFGNALNNNGVNPVSAQSSIGVQSHALLKRPASERIMLGLRDELFDKASSTLAAFVGIEPPPPQRTASSLILQSEPLAPHLFQSDEKTEEKDSTAGGSSTQTKHHADLIRHLIRNIHSSIHSADASLFNVTNSAPSTTSRSSLAASSSSSSNLPFASNPSLLHSLLPSHASNAHDDYELSFRLNVIALLYSNHHEKCERVRKDTIARRNASRRNWHNIGDSVQLHATPQSNAIDTTLRSFVAMNLQLLTAVHRLGAADVISSVLATSIDCFLRVPPLALCPATSSSSAGVDSSNVDLYRIFGPLFQFLTNIATNTTVESPISTAATLPSSSSSSLVVVSPSAATSASSSSSFSMSDRSRSLGILFGAALASGNLEEILHVLSLLYSHDDTQEDTAASTHLGAQLGQFVPALVAFESHSNVADDIATIGTPLFSHPHPLKLVPLAWTGSWVCDSHSSLNRTDCNMTGEGFVFHCDHNDGGCEGSIDAPNKPTEPACAYDFCTQCVRREKERQEKHREIQAGFPSLSPNAIIRALTSPSGAVPSFLPSSLVTAATFSSLATPQICAIILSQLDRLSLPFHPISSPSLTFTSPHTYHVRPSNHSILFDPISATASSYYLGTTLNSGVIVKPDLRKFREDATFSNTRRDAASKVVFEDEREGVRKAGIGTLQQPLKIHVSLRTLTLLSSILETASQSFTRDFMSLSSDASTRSTSSPHWLSHGLIISSCLRLLKAHLYQLHLSHMSFSELMLAGGDQSSGGSELLLARLQSQIEHFQLNLRVTTEQNEQRKQAVDSLAREATEALLAGFRFFFPTPAAQMQYALSIFQSTSSSSSPSLHSTSRTSLITFLNLHFAHFTFGQQLIDALLHGSNGAHTHTVLNTFLTYAMGQVEEETKHAMKSCSLDPDVAKSFDVAPYPIMFYPSGTTEPDPEATVAASSIGSSADIPIPRRGAGLALTRGLTLSSSGPTNSSRPPLARSQTFAPTRTPSHPQVTSNHPSLTRVLEDGATTANSTLHSAPSSYLLNSPTYQILENLQQFLLTSLGKSLQDLLDASMIAQKKKGASSDQIDLSANLERMNESKENEEKSNKEEAVEDEANASIHLNTNDTTLESHSQYIEESLLRYVRLFSETSERVLRYTTSEFLRGQESLLNKLEADGELVPGPRRSGAVPQPSPIRSVSTGASSTSTSTPSNSASSTSFHYKLDTISTSSPFTQSPLPPRSADSSRAAGLTRQHSYSALTSGITVAEQRWEVWRDVSEKIIRSCFVTTLGRPFLTSLHLLLSTPQQPIASVGAGGSSAAALAQHASTSSALALQLLSSLAPLISATQSYHSSLASVRTDREAEIETEERMIKNTRTTSRVRSAIATIPQGNLAPPHVLFKTDSTSDFTSTPNSGGMMLSEPLTDENFQEHILEMFPQAHMSIDRHSNAMVLLSPQTICRVGALPGGMQASCAMSSQALLPLPHRENAMIYFEVTIDELGEKGSIAVGLAPVTYSLHRMPGWDANSYAFHGDDGNRFHHAGTGAPYGPKFKKGDIVGCALNFDRREVFWTLNGKHLGVAFTQVDTSLAYHACVGMITPHEQATFNFGATPFCYQYLPPLQNRQLEALRDLHQTFLTPVIVSDAAESSDRSHEAHALLKLPGQCTNVLIICDHTSGTGGSSELVEIYAGVSKSGTRIFRDHRTNWSDEQFPVRYAKSYATDRTFVHFSAQCGYRITVMGIVMEPACGRWMRMWSHQLQALYAHSITNLLTSPSLTWQSLLHSTDTSRGRLLNGLQMLLASPGVFQFHLTSQQQRTPSAWKHTIQTVKEIQARAVQTNDDATIRTLNALQPTSIASTSSDSLTQQQQHDQFLQDILSSTGIAYSLMRVLDAAVPHKQRLMKSVEVYAERVSCALFACMLHHTCEVETALRTASTLTQSTGTSSSSSIPPILSYLHHLSLTMRQHFAALKGRGGTSSIIEYTNVAMQRIRFLLNLQPGAWMQGYAESEEMINEREKEKSQSLSVESETDEKKQQQSTQEEQERNMKLASEYDLGESKESDEIDSINSYTIKTVGRLKELLQLRSDIGVSPHMMNRTISSERAALQFPSIPPTTSKFLTDLIELIKAPAEKFVVRDTHSYFLAQQSGAVHRILAYSHLIQVLPHLSSASLSLILKWIGSCWVKDAPNSVVKSSATASYFGQKVASKSSASHYSHGLTSVPSHLASQLTPTYFNFLSQCLSHPSLDLPSQLFLFDLFNFDYDSHDLDELQKMDFVRLWLDQKSIGFSSDPPPVTSSTRALVRSASEEKLSEETKMDTLPPLSAVLTPESSATTAAATSTSSSTSPPPRSDHLLLRNVSWSLWRLIMYKTLEQTNRSHIRVRSHKAALQCTSIPSYSLHLIDQLYSHLQSLESVHSTQSHFERSLAMEALDAKRRAFLEGKQKKDAILESEKEREREEKRRREATTWSCFSCAEQMNLTQATCTACKAVNPDLIASASQSQLQVHDRVNCVYDFTLGGLPADVDDIDSSPRSIDPKESTTTVVHITSVQAANLVGPPSSAHWKFEADASATTIIPNNIGLDVHLPALIPLSNDSASANQVWNRASLTDYTLIIDFSIEFWPTQGSSFILFSPRTVSDLMTFSSSSSALPRDGTVRIDHNGRIGFASRVSPSSNSNASLVRVRTWHRMILVRDSNANTSTLMLGERTIDVMQGEELAQQQGVLKQPSKIASMFLLKHDAASTAVATPPVTPPFVSRVRLIQLKKYALPSNDLSLLFTLRSPGPSHPLPYADHGVNSLVTTHFDFCLETNSSQQKLPSGVSIHGKRKLEWRADNMKSQLLTPKSVPHTAPTRYFHVSPGTYLVLAHTLDQHNTPPLVKLITKASKDAQPTSAHFTAPHVLNTYTIIADVRIVSMNPQDSAAIFLMTRSPKKTSSSSSSASSSSSRNALSASPLPDGSSAAPMNKFPEIGTRTTSQPIATTIVTPVPIAASASFDHPTSTQVNGHPPIARDVDSSPDIESTLDSRAAALQLLANAASINPVHSPAPSISPQPLVANSAAAQSEKPEKSSSSSSSSSSRDRLHHTLLINQSGNFCFPSGVTSSLTPVGKLNPSLQLNQWHRVVIVLEDVADLQPGVSAVATPERGTEGGLRIYIDGLLHTESRGFAFVKHPGLGLQNPFLLGDPFAAHASQSSSKHKPTWAFDLRNVQVKGYAMRGEEISHMILPTPPFFCKLPPPITNLQSLTPRSSPTGAVPVASSLFFRPHSRSHLILHGPDVLKALSQPGHFSVACWVKVWKCTEIEQVLVSKPASQSASAWRVSLVRRNGVDTIVFGGIGKGTTAAQLAAFPFLSTTLPHRNRWVHIAATYDGSVYRLFVNGLVKKTGHSRTEFDGVNGPLVFGVLCSDSTHYLSHAAMADIAVWKSALSIHEVYAVRLGHTATTSRSALLCHLEFKESLTSSTPNVLLTNSVSHEWMHNHLKLMCIRGITYADVPQELLQPVKMISSVPPTARSTPLLAAAPHPSSSDHTIVTDPDVPLTVRNSRASSSVVTIDTSTINQQSSDSNTTALSLLNPQSPSFLRVRQFYYESDMDSNGLMYYLGLKPARSSSSGGNTAASGGGSGGGGGNQIAEDDDADDENDDSSDDGSGDDPKRTDREYGNPAERGHVTVTCSQYGDATDIAPITSVVGRTAERVMSASTRLDGETSYHWFAIDLHSRVFSPTHYTLRHYSTHDGGALRDWNFDGFDPKTNSWVTLRQHVNDTALQTRGQSYTWQVPATFHTRFFSKFRIIMTSTVNSADYLCLSGFELYGSLLLNTAQPSSSTTAVGNGDSHNTARHHEYTEWSQFGTHLNFSDSSIAWLLGTQQMCMTNETPVNGNASINTPTIFSVYQVKKRLHSASIAEINMAMLAWLWTLFRTLREYPNTLLLMQTASKDTYSIQQRQQQQHVTLRSWITLLLKLAQPSVNMNTRSSSVIVSPTPAADGGARLVRLLSLRSLRMLLPFISPSSLLSLDSSSSTSWLSPSFSSTSKEVTLSELLTPVLQLIGFIATPKSVLSLLKEYSTRRSSSSAQRLSSIHESLVDNGSSTVDSDSTEELDEATQTELAAMLSEPFGVSKGAPIPFAAFCANRLSFLPQEELREWMEMCAEICQQQGATNTFDHEWRQLLEHQLLISLRSVPSIIDQRQSQIISEETVPLPSSSVSPSQSPIVSSLAYTASHPGIDRARFMQLLASLNLLGGGVDVWKEVGRVEIKKKRHSEDTAKSNRWQSPSQQQGHRGTLLSIVRVSSLPYLVRHIKDKSLPIEVNATLQEGLYSSGGLLTDRGESVMVVAPPASQIPQATSFLAWTQMNMVPLKRTIQEKWTLVELFDLLKPLFALPSNPTDEVHHDDFLITVLRRYAFRVFSASSSHFNTTSIGSSSSSITSILTSLAGWSVRSLHPFTDGVNSIENLENRLKQMAIFEKEKEDDRLFMVREKKKTTKHVSSSLSSSGPVKHGSQQAPGTVPVASTDISKVSISSASSAPPTLQSFSSSLSVSGGTCSGVGSGLGLDRSSNLQLIQLPEHRKDKKKREKERAAESKESKENNEALEKCGREDIVYVASVGAHHAVLTSKGKVFHAVSTIGSNSSNPDRFVRLTFPDKTRIVQVAVGLMHTLLLTSEGRVWVMTTPEGAKTDTRSPQPEPQLLDEEIGGQRVLLIGTGSHHSFTLTHRGLYAFGANSLGQCGLGHTRTVKCPTLIRADDVPVESFVQIVGGMSHSLALTSKGVVFAWGALGLNEKGVSVTQLTPTKFALPTNDASDRVIQIVAAENHSLFLTDQGHVYSHSTGTCAPGVLGNESATELNRTPKRVKGALSTQICTMISTSRTVSAVLTLTHQIYIFGHEVTRGRPTSLHFVLTPTLHVPSSTVSFPVIFICCNSTMLLTLQSPKKQHRDLSNSPMTVQLASSKMTMNLAPYPSLACLIGDESRFYYQNEKDKKKIAQQMKVDASAADPPPADLTTAPVPSIDESVLINATNPAESNMVTSDSPDLEQQINTPLLDMVTAVDGLVGRHRMVIERVPVSDSATLHNSASNLSIASSTDESTSHIEGVRLTPNQKVVAYMALNTSLVQVQPTLTPFTPILPAMTPAAIVAPSPSLPTTPSVLTSQTSASTPPSAASAVVLPVGFTVSFRVCSMDNGDSDSAVIPVVTTPQVYPPHPGIFIGQSPLPTMQMNGAASPSLNRNYNLPMKLMTVQIPVDSDHAIASSPRALELCCDGSLSRFSLALLHAEKFHFDINLDDSKNNTSTSNSSSSSRSSKSKTTASTWHTVTVVCSNVDKRLMVRVFIDGFCYLRCTDPRHWAMRECDMPLTPAFLSLAQPQPQPKSLFSSRTLPITILEGWNGRCSDLSVWMHALNETEVSYIHSSGLFYLTNDLLEYRISQETQQMHHLHIARRDPSTAPSSIVSSASFTAASYSNWSPSGSPMHTQTSSTPSLHSISSFTILTPAEETVDSTVSLLATNASAGANPLPTQLQLSHFAPSAAPHSHIAPLSPPSKSIGTPLLNSSSFSERRAALTGGDMSDATSRSSRHPTNVDFVFHLPNDSTVVLQRRICASESALSHYTFIMDCMLLRRPTAPICVFQSSPSNESALVHLLPNLTLSIFGRAMSPHKFTLGVWHRIKLSVSAKTGMVLLILDHFCVAGYRMQEATNDIKRAQLHETMCIFPSDASRSSNDLGIEIRAIQLTRDASTLQQLLSSGACFTPLLSIRNLVHATRSLVNQGFPARWSTKAFLTCDGNRRAASRWLLLHAAQLTQADEESQLTASVAGLSDIGVTVGKCKAALLRSQVKRISSEDGKTVTNGVDYEKAVSWLLYHADAEQQQDGGSTWELLEQNNSESGHDEKPQRRLPSALSSSSRSSASTVSDWRWKLDRAQVDRPAAVGAMNPTFMLEEDANEVQAAVPSSNNANASKRGDSSSQTKFHFLRLPILAESEKSPENTSPPLIIRQPMYKKWLKHRSSFLMQRLDVEENLIVLYARRTLLQLLTDMPKEKSVAFVLGREATPLADELLSQLTISVPSSSSSTSSSHRFLVPFMRLLHHSYFSPDLLERFAERITDWMIDESAAIDSVMESSIHIPTQASIMSDATPVIAPLSFSSLLTLAPISCMLIEEVIFQLVLLIQHAHDEMNPNSGVSDATTSVASTGDDKSKVANSNSTSSSSTAAPTTTMTGSVVNSTEGDDPLLSGAAAASSVSLLVWLLGIFNRIRLQSLPLNGSTLSINTPSLQRRLYLLSKHLFCPQVMNLLFESVVVCLADTRITLLALLSGVLDTNEEHTTQGIFVSNAASSPSSVFLPNFTSTTIVCSPVQSPPLTCPTFSYPFLQSKPWLLKHLMLRLYQTYETKNSVWSLTLQTIIELNMKLENAQRLIQEVAHRRNAKSDTTKLKRRSSRATASPKILTLNMQQVTNKLNDAAALATTSTTHSTACSPSPTGDDDDEEEEDLNSSLLRSLTLASLDFMYKSDFDKNGIIYHLGYDPDTQTWKNPATLVPPQVKVTSSGRHTTYAEEFHLSRVPVVALTSASQGSWICFDFIDRAVIPTHYTLRHYTQASYALRHWVFEGSTDGEEWVPLRVHTNDTSLSARDATCTWSIDLDSSQLSGGGRFLIEPFRKLRIRMTGTNSSGSGHLVCSGFEVYGKLIDWGALNVNRSGDASSTSSSSTTAATSIIGSSNSNSLSCPPSPVWFQKVMLSQQYMLAFHPDTKKHNGFDMFRIPMEFARTIFADYQATTNEYIEKKGVNIALGKAARQSSTAILSSHLLPNARASAVYTHTPYGYASAQHAIDGFFHDTVFTQAITTMEEAPWIEVDLGAMQNVGEVVVFQPRRHQIDNGNGGGGGTASFSRVVPHHDRSDSSSLPPSLAINTNSDTMPTTPPQQLRQLANAFTSPRLMRQTSILASNHANATVASVSVPAPPAPSYIVIMSEAPLPIRQVGMSVAAFIDSLKAQSCYVGTLVPVTPSSASSSSFSSSSSTTSPAAHPFELIQPGTMHVRVDTSTASAISTPTKARFVRVIYTGRTELRVNQLAVFAPSLAASSTGRSHSLSSGSLSAVSELTPTTTPNPGGSGSTPATHSSNTGSSSLFLTDPHRTSSAPLAIVPPSMTFAAALAHSQAVAQAHWHQSSASTTSTSNTTTTTTSGAAAPSAIVTPQTLTAATINAATPARRKDTGSNLFGASSILYSSSGSSSHSGSSSSSDSMSLVPFYTIVSLFNSQVAIELLTYLHRVCEKRNINIHELNILADPPPPERDGMPNPPPGACGVALPLTPTELLQYPELARLGPDIYDNSRVLKLYLLLLQHFNKIIMSLLPLIDFSPQKHQVSLVSNSSSLTSSSSSSSSSSSIPSGLHLADSIRSIRHFLLWTSKRNVWEQSLAATVASIPKPNIDVDLLAASQVSWSQKTDIHARRTVFGQIFRQRSKLLSINFRLIRSARAFTVNYVGMRATDAGGPYRDACERMGLELQSNVLPLFVKAPNSQHDGSLARADVFVPRPSSRSPQQILMFEFVGKLIGLAIRTKNLWNLSLPSLVWKFLVAEEIGDDDIKAIDTLAYSQLERMTTIANSMQKDATSASTSTSTSTTGSSIIDPSTLTSILSPAIKFTLIDSEGRQQPLLPNGEYMRVSSSNFAEYVRLIREYRYHEFDLQLRAIKRGLSSVIPPSVLSLLTWRELESQVVGRGLGVEDVDLLEKMTKYSGCTRAEKHIDTFWRMMRERLTDEQRAQFLIFTYGRSRLPSSQADLDTSFTIMRATRSAAANAAANASPQLLQSITDRQLATSHTCGFALELPAYSSIEVMTERILYAIAHCSEVDADGGSARTGTYRIEEEEEEEETEDEQNDIDY